MRKKDNAHKRLASATWYQEFNRFVDLKGLAKRTRQTYLGWVHQLADHYPKSDLPELPPESVLDFLIHIQDERKLRPSTVNQAVCSLRTLYRDHLGIDWDIWKKIQIKFDEPLPHVLTREEVLRLLQTFRCPRFKTFFTLVYQCGLRLNEALHIKPKHINGERLVILIPETHSKSRKAREVPITPRLLKRLRTFWLSHRNREWLFPGMGRGWKSSGLSVEQAMHRSTKSMSESSVWQAIAVAVAECGLSKTHVHISTHTLRHSFATHMLEGNASIIQVASYLGHSSLKDTIRYLHVTEISDQKGREALDTLVDPGESEGI
ncbi:tyrosine-type recombinase/integrase [Haloferula chungangensis]|uniref:Tyrosine-type recombinase/integrase n=1 Tax=Haloferula chungangensis TaxID=1048331 RepID=A0ABW2LAM0_9BACT